MIFQITHLKRLLFSSLVFLLPGVVEGLGLGKISSYSGINEPFVGVVEVKGISAEQIDKLTVSLASPEEFKYAGLNYSKHVGSLRFTPSRSASGKPIIRISSAEAITEPFLGIVLNIKSASGSASKEYMVALEPETTTSTVKAVSEPVGQEKSYQINDETNNQLQQKAVVFPLRHGPIQTQESLLGIAKSYSVPGVSASQIAMAFYRYNQDAFIRGDINRLRASAVLQIPQHDAILETTRGVAEMELQHLIRGEPVVVSLPQIAPQTDLPLPTDDSESVPRQTPNEKISSSGDQLVGSKGATESQARSDEEHEKNYPPSISSYPLNYGPVRAGESLESVTRQLGPNDALS